MKHRVVVTGIGVVSSIGIGHQAFWESLMAGVSGISEITAFDTSEFPTHRGGEVKEFHPKGFMTSAGLRRYSRASQFAVAASKMALEDARLYLKDVIPSRAGVVIGTTMAEAQALEMIDSIWVRKDVTKIPIRLIPQYPGNIISAHVAAELDLQGPNMVIATACAAGNYSIAHAYDLIQCGRADVMFAGGADAFSRVAFTGFNRLLAVAPERCQPFDRQRKGMMLGEGAGIMTLESLNRAQARRAPIYAEVLGYGLSCDANHMTIPAVDGLVQVLRRALKDANLSPDQVNYVSAHGTGTVANDRSECAAIRRVFGPYAEHLPVSSIKSMLGHTMGAASALEAISCALAISDGRIPPTINYEEADPECNIDCVPNRARRVNPTYVLNNAFAFGGNNACVVFGKLRETLPEPGHINVGHN